MSRCYLIIGCLLIITTGCRQIFSAAHNDDPKAVILKSAVNYHTKANGKLVSQVVSDSTTIISYNGYYIYKKSMIVTSDTVLMRSDSTIIGEKKGKVDTIQRCYIYKAKEKSGWIFNGADTITAGKFPVDSFLRANAYNNVDVSDYVIASSEFLADGTRDYYMPKAKKDADMPDSVILSYHKGMADIGFYSLSFDLEAKKKQKLVSAKYVLNATAQMPEQVISVSITETPVTDTGFLKKLIAIVR